MNSIFKWKDKLPIGWKASPLKAIASYAVSSVDKLTDEEEISVELCNYTDVYNNDFITLDLEFMKASATDEEVKKYSLLKGDILITKDSESWDDIGIPALVLNSKPRLLCGYHLALIRPDLNIMYPEFLFRCIQSKEIRVQLELSSRGVTRFGLPKDAVGTLTLPVPKLTIQKKIIAYLDDEIYEIDKLIKAKQSILSIFFEKQQSLITHAVTQGIIPNVKLKHSEIEWLGKVPEHWRTERSKWLFKERNERSEFGEEEMLTVSHITGVTPRSEKNVNMFEAETNEGYKLCNQGDLVINTLWAWMGAMGTAPVSGMVSPAYHVYTPLEEILPSYIDTIVRLPIFAAEVIKYSKGVWSSRLRLYPDGFYEVFFPVPPLEEQIQIVNFIQAETNKIDQLKKAATKTIDLLKERRSALISAIVTGQIKIP